MSLRDLRSEIGAVESIRPQVATGDVTGETVDVRGFNSACFLVATGEVAGGGDFTFAAEHSEDGVSWEAIPAEELDGSPSGALLANTVARVGYLGNRRFLRSGLSHNGGTSIAVASPVILGSADVRPVS